MDSAGYLWLQIKIRFFSSSIIGFLLEGRATSVVSFPNGMPNINHPLTFSSVLFSTLRNEVL